MAPANDKSASKKPKLVRDSFTIPKNEFAAIEALKARAIALGTSVKKSELLRAGLMALQGLSDAAYKAAVAAVPTLKTGRPAAAKAPATKPVAAPAKKKAAAKKPVAKKAAKPAAKAAPAKKAVRKTAPVKAA
ncbi:hypothetical protein [Hydrogenophaga sp.]|uniref:hypothetical protein n=1 Tax=Hydrogenophaga sp. TaxID=1904254 RepID=UPI0025BF00CA|nr:hypothetical protein [Hydrogenophaga sp.]